MKNQEERSSGWRDEGTEQLSTHWGTFLFLRRGWTGGPRTEDRDEDPAVTDRAAFTTFSRTLKEFLWFFGFFFFSVTLDKDAVVAAEWFCSAPMT